MSFKNLLPPSLGSSYKNLSQGPLVQDHNLTEENIAEFQRLLNEAQPTEQETTVRQTIQMLYRRSPQYFYQFLVKNQLARLVLWTESKCIVRHFGLQGLVYIRWDKETEQYVVMKHNNADDVLEGKIQPRRGRPSNRGRQGNRGRGNRGGRQGNRGNRSRQHVGEDGEGAPPLHMMSEHPLLRDLTETASENTFETLNADSGSEE